MRPFSTPLRWLGVLALTACIATPALAQRNVTLRMNSATMPDTVKADASAGVAVRGCLDGCTGDQSALPGGQTIAWNDNTTLKPTNDGGDYWTIDFQIPDNEKLNFKFYIDQSETAGVGGWEEGGNQEIAAGTGDVTLDLHYFEKVAGDQAYDWRPFAAAGDSIAVWFRVYMLTDQALDKGYSRDDDALVVGVRGNFGTLGATDNDGAITDWGSGSDDDQIVALTRESEEGSRPGYDLFSGVVRYPASAASAADNPTYKFYFRDANSTGDGGYESADNRSFTLPDAGRDTTLHWVYYGNSPAADAPVNQNEVTREVSFSVDVTPVNSIGLFTTSDDKIQIRGQVVMTDWSDCQGGANPTDGCVLTQSVSGDLIYNSDQNITGEAGDEFQYKYFVDFNNPDGSPQFDDGTDNADNELVLGWEEPLDYGGANRRLTFSGEDTVRETEFFNSIRDGNLIPSGETVDVQFTVDMSGAAAFGSRAFNPATDSVTVVFEDPIWLFTQGYDLTFEDGGLVQFGSNRGIAGFKLSDPDGDLVYTGSLTVNGPTYNAIGYHYAFGGTSATGLYEEGTRSDGAFGRRRYRYITDTSNATFEFGRDVFRPNNSDLPSGIEVSLLPWEVNPTGPFVAGDWPASVRNGYDDTGNLATSTPTGPASDALSLGNVYPNPTTGTARVVVSGRADARVSVRVYDVTGRVVATVAEDAAIDGRPLEFDVSGLASGLYLVRADSEAGVATQRLTVVR